SAPVDDPPRLRSTSTLGLLLDEARTEKLDDEARARAWRSIEIAAAAGAVSAGAGAAKSGGLFGKLGALSLSKIGVASLVVLLGGVLAVVAWRAHAPAPTAAPAAPTSLVAELEPPAAAAAPAADPAPVAGPAHASMPSTSAAAAPAPAAAPAVSFPSTSKSAPPPEEGRLLLDAKAALGSDPRRSLALTTAHARAFPTSALGAERESIAIDALARLGRCGEARARAQRFLAAFPSSPHRALITRLEAGCGE
ncbi:MAG: hypothetical protein ABI134_01180, partial [Byssovorax sp.]